MPRIEETNTCFSLRVGRQCKCPLICLSRFLDSSRLRKNETADPEKFPIVWIELLHLIYDLEGGGSGATFHRSFQGIAQAKRGRTVLRRSADHVDPKRGTSLLQPKALFLSPVFVFGALHPLEEVITGTTDNSQVFNQCVGCLKALGERIVSYRDVT